MCSCILYFLEHIANDCISWYWFADRKVLEDSGKGSRPSDCVIKNAMVETAWTSDGFSGLAPENISLCHAIWSSSIPRLSKTLISAFQHQLRCARSLNLACCQRPISSWVPATSQFYGSCNTHGPLGTKSGRSAWKGFRMRYCLLLQVQIIQ